MADSPEAAKLLSQAAEDLRRDLEERDVTLLSLDVSTSGDQRRRRPPSSADGFGEQPTAPAAAATVRSEDAGLMEHQLAETTLVLPNGVHVDVLA